MGYDNWADFVSEMEGNYKTGMKGFEDAQKKFDEIGISAS
jgi:hypothetical protein